MNELGMFYLFMQPGVFLKDITNRHDLPDRVKNDIFPEGHIPTGMDVRRINWQM